MKLFAPALIFCGAAAFGQSPQVPHKMQFAGMTLSIRDDARREIQTDVDALTQSPKYFGMKAERARTYFPIIEKIFAEERLPLDFKYLALQESALVPDAVSSSNAVGFWQFKDFTAREMGLRVDEEIDERMNIASASLGAARYLKQCNHYFNNWVYALQAYQMGAGGVMRAVGDQGNGSRHMEITSDTYWYVKKFLAHKVAFEDATGSRPQLSVTIHVPVAGTRIADIAQSMNVDEAEIRSFNKWLKVDEVPADKPYAMIIPKGEIHPDFGVLATSKPKPRVDTAPMAATLESINGVQVIRSQPGETLQAIASRGKVGLSAFLRFNEMAIDYSPSPGEAFFLSKKKKTGSQDLYTVRKGEDLWRVSQQMGMRMKFIRKFNQLEKDGKLSAGTTLYLQSKRLEEQPAAEVVQLDEGDVFEWAPVKEPEKISITPDPTTLEASVRKQSTDPVGNTDLGQVRTHEVKPSDTLYSVARQYGVTIQELMEWNNKKDFTLAVGEKLRIRP